MVLPRVTRLGGSEKTVAEALYNLRYDIGERDNRLRERPDVVTRLRELAHKCREDLGDVNLNRRGKNCRPQGRGRVIELISDHNRFRRM